MKTNRLLQLIFAVISFSGTHSAIASLIGVLPATPGGTDYRAIYDNVANLTWLKDANYIETSGFTSAGTVTGGRTQWSDANDFVAGLNINGVTGWRLPTTPQVDPSCGLQNPSHGGYCTGSELGNLYYNVLGGVYGTPIGQYHNNNYNFFSNVKDGVYWSSTEYYLVSTAAWGFTTNGGGTSAYDKAGWNYAWAVHVGDVSTVPIPAAVWLFSSALLGLSGIGRRKAVR